MDFSSMIMLKNNNKTSLRISDNSTYLGTDESEF